MERARKGQNGGARGQRGPGGKEKPGRGMSRQGQEAALDQRPRLGHEFTGRKEKA